MKIRVIKSLYSFFIVVIYLVLGSLVILKYSVWQEEPSMSLASFGLVVIAYGLFRGYRAYREYKTLKEEDNGNE